MCVCRGLRAPVSRPPSGARCTPAGIGQAWLRARWGVGAWPVSPPWAVASGRRRCRSPRPHTARPVSGRGGTRAGARSRPGSPSGPGTAPPLPPQWRRWAVPPRSSVTASERWAAACRGFGACCEARYKVRDRSTCRQAWRARSVPLWLAQPAATAVITARAPSAHERAAPRPHVRAGPCRVPPRRVERRQVIRRANPGRRRAGTG